MKIRIYYKHTDLGGIVYHSNYIDFCEMARSELFFSQGKSPVINGCHFALKNINCNFLAPATLGDLLEVKTKVVQIKAASIVIHHDIYLEEKPIFTMDATLVFLCKGMKISKIPADIVEFFKQFK